jgi:N-methylhydantoinase A/oxoprolinase/acetone carboxylase beta subunit
MPSSPARRMILEKYSIQVILSRTLTGDLGIMEKTVTAVLNAKLIPIMGDFMAAVERSLESRGSDAHIMVFKGDGGLMSIEAARENVEASGAEDVCVRLEITEHESCDGYEKEMKFIN